MPKNNKALFLDRDGVVNEDTGYPYLPEHIVFRPGIFDFCARAQRKGYRIVIITNQAGVARGKFTESDVRRLHSWMISRFRGRGIEIAGIYYCPHHPEAVVEEYRTECPCRKPGPGLIERAARELDIDVSRSVMVGDKPTDRIAFGGLRSVILKSGYCASGYDVASLDGIVSLL